MRDDCYQAKLWLNRNYYSSRQLAADRRMLAATISITANNIQSRIYDKEADNEDS